MDRTSGNASLTLKILASEFELPGFDLGEIQNIVDELQQMRGSLFDVIHKALLLVIELARQSAQPAGPKNPQSRSAEFVTHGSYSREIYF